MTTQKIGNGLIQLGFDSGWVISGEEIVVWEHTEPIPAMDKILEAAKLYAEPELTVQDKLSSVGLSIDDLKLALGI